jgi:hypothetical protein
MTGRRALIRAGVAAGLGAAAGAGTVGASAAPTAPMNPMDDAQRRSTSDEGDVERSVEAVRAEVGRLRTEWNPGSGAVAQIRVALRQFLKGQHRFPEFVDVGIGVWEDIYDWHVRFQQPIVISRQPDGRYAMVFMQTLLVLRPEQSDTYIGAPYDRQ